MNGRERVIDTDKDPELRHNFLSCLWVITKDVQGTNSLTIQAHNLGERLSNHDVVSFIDEDPNTGSIFDEVTGHKTLVCCVKEGSQLLFFKKFS